MLRIGPASNACFFLYSGESLSSAFCCCDCGVTPGFGAGGFCPGGGYFGRGGADAAAVDMLSGDDREGYDIMFSLKGTE